MRTRQPGLSRVGRIWFACARGLLIGVERLYFRLRVEGTAFVPQDGAFVLAPTHRSVVDVAVAASITRRRMRYMVADARFRPRLIGRLLGSLGAIPVQGGVADRNAVRLVEDALAAGEPVVIFPEGSRQEGPLVQPLFDGVAHVAAHASVPILPVGIAGSENARPKGARFLRPVRVCLVIGAPIYPPARSEDGTDATTRVICELTTRLHAELQLALDAARRRAGGR